MNKPNLFLVGAPKCGTTTMYRYLAAHPDVFMSPVKEPHFFGSDFVDRYGVQDREAYEALFDGANGEKWRGEGSVWYLYSTRAAEEIRAYEPDARIIIMLREPADMMYSLHSQRLYSGNEDITDFGLALEAEPERARGERIPPTATMTQGLQYRNVCRYAEQVSRFFDAFGRERVHVVLYDDLRANAMIAYHNLLAFLDLEPDDRAEFRAHNKQKPGPRSMLFNRVIRKPPPIIRTILHRFISEDKRRLIAQRALAFNAQEHQRSPLGADLRQALVREFVPEVEKLERLLGRELPEWKEAR